MECGRLCGSADAPVIIALTQRQMGLAHLLMHQDVSAVDMLEEPVPGDAEEEHAPRVKEGEKKRRRNP